MNLAKNTRISKSFRIVFIIIAVHGLLYALNIGLVISVSSFFFLIYTDSMNFTRNLTETSKKRLK